MLPVFPNREEHILKLVADGLTNREISRRLMISESTVENHIHHIYAKLGISNRTQAVARAFRLGIVVHRLDVMGIEGILHDETIDSHYDICHFCPLDPFNLN